MAVYRLGVAAKRVQLAQANHHSAIFEILRKQYSENAARLAGENLEPVSTVARIDTLGQLAAALTVDARTGNPSSALDGLSDELWQATQAYHDALQNIQEITNRIIEIAPH